ncbi:unnamed protein product [Schistosoma curassoni]|uniref:DUF4537 domain-containing protein n=1 Tax=Schistosoma curassoni TaxID=6186 RepID=A0A183JYX4_9TREM|nr:unnamed protein product [Schistosoma curassoni]
MGCYKESVLWPISGYTIMIWIVDELIHNYYLLNLIKLSLLKLTHNKKYRFNIALSVTNPTKFCEEFIICSEKNICTSLRWVKAFEHLEKPEAALNFDFNQFTSDKAFEIYLFVPTTILYKFGGDSCSPDKITHFSTKASVHIRLIVSEKTGVNEHVPFSETDAFGVEILKSISQLASGTFAIVRLCSFVKTCSNGCTTWLLGKHERGSNHMKTSKRSKEIQIHMLSFIDHSQPIKLPCGKVYVVSDSIEHEPVLMKPTLSASSEFTDRYFRPHTCPNSFSTSDCCIHPHLWSRVFVNEKLVNDLNRRIYESAKDEANSRKCLFNWFTDDYGQKSSLLDNKKVLARRSSDGHYYLGSVQTVKSHLPVDQVFIRFGPIHNLTSFDLRKSRSTTSNSDTFHYEWLDITEIIDLEHAIRHSIEPGDCVLVPYSWPFPKCPILNVEKPSSFENLRYYAAIVVSGREQRADKLTKTKHFTDDQKLLVELASSNTRVGHIYVPKQKAVWISPNTYQRIVLEQYMTPECRKWLKNKTFLPNSYPFQSAPGYPADGFGRFKSYKNSLQSDLHIQPLTFQQFRHGADVQFEYCPSLQCWPLYSVVNDLLPVTNGCPVWCDNEATSKNLIKLPTSKVSNNHFQSSGPNCEQNFEPKLVYRSRNKHYQLR